MRSCPAAAAAAGQPRSTPQRRHHQQRLRRPRDRARLVVHRRRRRRRRRRGRAWSRRPGRPTRPTGGRSTCTVSSVFRNAHSPGRAPRETPEAESTQVSSRCSGRHRLALDQATGGRIQTTPGPGSVDGARRSSATRPRRGSRRSRPRAGPRGAPSAGPCAERRRPAAGPSVGRREQPGRARGATGRSRATSSQRRPRPATPSARAHDRRRDRAADRPAPARAAPS